MGYKALSSEQKFKGAVFNVRQDRVLMPNGNTSLCDIVEHSGGVSILPVDHNENIWLIRQYRHPAGRLVLEIPAGKLEIGEAPELCAAREIREEIGMAAGEITHLGEVFLAPGYSSDYMYVYLARDLTPSPLPGDENEIIEIEKYPVDEVYRMADAGEIIDAKTLVALFLAREKLTGDS